MWFGILTPGAHPSRPIATPEATVFAWTPDDRRRIDGPFALVHGGLRVTRRAFYDEGLVSCPPRCFVCLRACPVPDAVEVQGLDDVPETEVIADTAPVRPPVSALLAFVQLAELDGPADTPLDEEVLITVAGTRIAALTPLERVPDTLTLLSRDMGLAPVGCTRCGTVLPGSAAQRRAKEAGGNRRQRRGHARRAA